MKSNNINYIGKLTPNALCSMLLGDIENIQHILVSVKHKDGSYVTAISADVPWEVALGLLYAAKHDVHSRYAVVEHNSKTIPTDDGT